MAECGIRVIVLQTECFSKHKNGNIFYDDTILYEIIIVELIFTNMKMQRKTFQFHAEELLYKRLLL